MKQTISPLWLIVGSILIFAGGALTLWFLWPFFMHGDEQPKIDRHDLPLDKLLTLQHSVNDRLQHNIDRMNHALSDFQCPSLGENNTDATSNDTTLHPEAFLRREYSKADMFTQMQESVVRVINQKENGTGSAFFITDDTLMTNAHVVKDATEVLVYSTALTPTPVTAQVIAHEYSENAPNRDFALLRLSAPISGAKALPFNSHIAPFEEVIALGYPGVYQIGADISQSRLIPQSGEVTFQDDINGSDMIAHSAKLYPGNSGGPLINHCGEVIGINTLLLSLPIGPQRFGDKTADINISFPYTTFVDFLHDNHVAVRHSDNPCL